VKRVGWAGGSRKGVRRRVSPRLARSCRLYCTAEPRESKANATPNQRELCNKTNQQISQQNRTKQLFVGCSQIGLVYTHLLIPNGLHKGFIWLITFVGSGVIWLTKCVGSIGRSNLVTHFFLSTWHRTTDLCVD
jgi:hypothetical protein